MIYKPNQTLQEHLIRIASDNMLKPLRDIFAERLCAELAAKGRENNEKTRAAIDAYLGEQAPYTPEQLEKAGRDWRENFIKEGTELLKSEVPLPECSDAPDGKHSFTADIEYDPSGETFNCEHCGMPRPEA